MQNKEKFVNEDLRTNLLTLIKTLQGSISRTNINELNNTIKPNNNKSEKTLHKKIGLEFSRTCNNKLYNNDFINNFSNKNVIKNRKNFRNKLKKELGINYMNKK